SHVVAAVQPRGLRSRRSAARPAMPPAPSTPRPAIALVLMPPGAEVAPSPVIGAAVGGGGGIGLGVGVGGGGGAFTVRSTIPESPFSHRATASRTPGVRPVGRFTVTANTPALADFIETGPLSPIVSPKSVADLDGGLHLIVNVTGRPGIAVDGSAVSGTVWA